MSILTTVMLERWHVYNCLAIAPVAPLPSFWMEMSTSCRFADKHVKRSEVPPSPLHAPLAHPCRYSSQNAGGATLTNTDRL